MGWARKSRGGNFLLQCSKVNLQRLDFSLYFDFEVPTGKLLTLLGTSGAGKSSILHCIAGFETPDAGDILLNGKSIMHLAPQKRNTHIVFQDYALFPHMTVGENIAYGMKVKKYAHNEIQQRVQTLMKMLHIEQYQDSFVTNISGGEQQRVALARAIATKPDLLLLDEPLGAVDVALRTQLRKEIRSIQQEQNLTSIYVTHDQEEAFAISDYIAIVNNGYIKQIGKPQDIYYRPKNEFVAKFLGECTILQSTVLESTEKLVLLDTPIGKFEYSPDNSSLFVPTQQVNLCVRPNQITILSQDMAHHHPSNTYTGQIVSEDFRGAYSLLEVAIYNTIIPITVSRADVLTTKKIKFHINNDISILEYSSSIYNN